jgi:uncharacterized membrane protein YkvA (DUF1232 family)
MEARMAAFFEVVKVFIIGCFAFLALFVVLLALPASRLRSFIMELMAWGTAGASVVYVVSPLDLLPDVIPVLGWGDDLVAVITAIGSVALALQMRRKRALIEAREARYLGR